jgi:hypothetical protein
LSIGNSSGRFGSLGSSDVERVGDLVAALEWPSICCTTFTSAPLAMPRLAGG